MRLVRVRETIRSSTVNCAIFALKQSSGASIKSCSPLELLLSKGEFEDNAGERGAPVFRGGGARGWIGIVGVSARPGRTMLPIGRHTLTANRLWHLKLIITIMLDCGGIDAIDLVLVDHAA